MVHNCRWVLIPNSPGVVAKYCEAPVGYTLPTDDDGNKYRKYNTFCTEHKARFELEFDEEEY
jgi:hypothetical protein